MAKGEIAYIGCRTAGSRGGKGKGISTYRTSQTGPWTLLHEYETPNPGFLATDSQSRWLYSVEADGMTISSFEIAEDHSLTPINSVSVHGVNPVHVNVSPDDRFAIVCNHVTKGDLVSSIVSFPINADGSLGEAIDVLVMEGETGPNREAQPYTKPHNAQFSPDGTLIAVADKGLDEVQFFTLDDAGKFTWLKDHTVRVPWGGGPRDIFFHPTLPYLYLINELDSTVVVIALRGKDGRPEAIQRWNNQSDAFTYIHRAGVIEVSKDGRTVYAGNRGQNSIATYRVDEVTGKLTPLDRPDSGGVAPRHFTQTPSGSHLVVANEFSHLLTQFTIAQDGNLIDPIKVADTGSPTCILFI